MLLTVRFGSLDKQIYPAGARNDAVIHTYTRLHVVLDRCARGGLCKVTPTSPTQLCSFQELNALPPKTCGEKRLRRATKHQRSHRTNGVPRWNHRAATDFSPGAGRPACMARRSSVSPGASSKKL